MTTVGDVMTRSLETVEAEDSIQHAAELMANEDIGSLPVLEDGHIKGIVTDRDITIRATAAGVDPNTTPVRDVMTRSVVACAEDQPIGHAATLMEEHQIRRIVVCDRQNKPVGILSLGDIALNSHNRNMTAEVLEEICVPT